MFKKIKPSNLIISFLIILALGTITTYSYFVKYMDISNDLKFRTGSLIVKLGDNVNEATKSIKINDIKPGAYGSDTFKIKNNGTLNAKFKLLFSVQGAKDRNLLDNFKCVITFRKGNENYREIRDTFFNLVNNTNGFELANDNGIMILNPNEEIDCKFTVYLDDTIDFRYENSKTNFSITVKAIQT